MHKTRAVKKYIIVSMIQEEQKQGVIIVPQEKKDVSRAHVISVGEEAIVPFVVGDVVMIRSYAGQKLPFHDTKEDIRVLSESEVLAWVDEHELV